MVLLVTTFSSSVSSFLERLTAISAMTRAQSGSGRFPDLRHQLGFPRLRQLAYSGSSNCSHSCRPTSMAASGVLGTLRT
jgi:hypothetical protein